MSPISISISIHSQVKKYGDLPAITAADRYKGDEDRTMAPLQTWTWATYYAACLDFGKSLIKVGMKPHQSVNIIGFNSPEWVIADLGCIAAGGIAAGQYTTNLPDACQYVAAHSEAKVVVCQGKKQLEKFAQIYKQLPDLVALVVYDYEPTQADKDSCGDKDVYSWNEFMALGKEVADADINKRIDDQKPNQCCCLIYTSGTTGPPKAVMISHDNITWTSRRVLDWVTFAPGDAIVSYLPLSHIAAQMLDIAGPLHIGAHVSFADPMALKGSLAVTLRRVQPALFFGVPRVWEKIGEKIRAAGAQSKGIKKKIAMWAKGKGADMAAAKQYNSGLSKPGCYGCASTLVFSKVKNLLGLNRVKACFTGAAPIGMDTLNLFAALDVPVLELFGQSECTGPATTNTPDMWKIGSVGVPLNGTVMTIVEGTKEIVYGGRHIFMGYLKMPEKTAETIDEKGMLHSGDMGRLDPGPNGGFLSITGRIKELIITAGGENIPPVLIEDQIKSDCDALSNVMVVGDRRKYLVALYTLKQKMTFEGAPDPAGTLDMEAAKTSAEIGSDAKTVADVRECAKWKDYLQKCLDKSNAEATSRAQKIQKFEILPEDFSVPGGELGPTLKLKRPAVNEKYGDTIERVYA